MLPKLLSNVGYYGRVGFSYAMSPFRAVRQIISPINCEATLTKISRIAKRGFDQAQDPYQIKTGAEHLKRLNDGLKKEAPKKELSLSSEFGPVAEIAGLEKDPEVTEAVPPQISGENWEARMEKQKERLKDKLTAFTVLMQMRDRAGIKEDDNLFLMSLVKKATEKEEGIETLPSLWELFLELTQKYDISLFQKIKAAWFYWIYYQTSLITNVIDSYVESILKDLTKDLTSENHATRSALFRTFLENTNQFLIADLRGTENFTYGREAGDLKQCRDRAVKNHYQNDLGTLCKNVCEKLVERACKEDDPEKRVAFFRDAQEIPVIGVLFIFFEWALNKYLIKGAMKSSILPAALQSGVNNGIGATKPQNLPFTIALTRFFSQQLETYRDLLEDQLKGQTSSSKVTPFPGTEMLSATVKNLMTVLDLEPFETRLELKKKLEEMEKVAGYVDTKIQTNIQDGVIEGGHFLFKYLDERAKSKELFARLLELACLPFSGERKSLETLQAEFKAEQEKLERTAGDVVEKLIRSSIHKTKTNPESSKKIGDQLLSNRKKVLELSLEELQKLTLVIEKKIDQAEQNPNSSNNIQKDLVSLLQILEVLVNHNTFQDKIEGLTGSHTTAIWELLYPILNQLKTVGKKALVLQKSQSLYPSHKTVEDELRKMNKLLVQAQRDFHTQPHHHQAPLLRSIENSIKKIESALKPKAPLVLKLRSYAEQIEQITLKEAEEHKKIEAIEALSSPNEQRNGLLEQLANFENGAPSALIEQIDETLSLLPEKEQQEIREIIGDGTQLRRRWDALHATIQRTYETYKRDQEQYKNELNALIEQISPWMKEKTSSYQALRERDFNKMRGEISSIVETLKKCRAETNKIKADLNPSLRDSIRRAGEKAGAQGQILFAKCIGKDPEKRVREVFSNAVKFCTGSSRDRVWEALATRTLVELAK
jgi:hypothetical protein